MGLASALAVDAETLLTVRSPPEITCLLMAHAYALALDKVLADREVHVRWLERAAAARRNISIPHVHRHMLDAAVVLLGMTD